MGQSQSGSALQRDLESERADVFASFPGFEQQIEMAFSSHDLDDVGEIEYYRLEPLLRHQLVQVGLTEYLPRFVRENGELNSEEVSPLLDLYGVDLYRPLDILDYKNLVLAWIRRIQEAQQHDVQNWQQSLLAMQRDQAMEYEQAMKTFQEEYVPKLEGYYKQVEEIHKKEEAYRKEWEKNQVLQQEFFDAQTQYLQQQNEAALAGFHMQLDQHRNTQVELIKRMKDAGGEYGPGTLRFVYPSDVTTTGAPVSGGCQVPGKRRRRNVVRKGGCC